MIHRAILGSFERFAGMLLEHHEGALPAWLAPVQVVVPPVADAQRPYAVELVERLRAVGIRVESMGGGMTLSRAMVDARNVGAPIVAVVGRREVESRAVTLGDRAGDKRSLPLDEASVKVRTGPPVDDDEDLDLPVWAGVLPLSLAPGPPEGDPLQDHRVAVPPYVSRYARPR